MVSECLIPPGRLKTRSGLSLHRTGTGCCPNCAPRPHSQKKRNERASCQHGYMKVSTQVASPMFSPGKSVARDRSRPVCLLGPPGLRIGAVATTKCCRSPGRCSLWKRCRDPRSHRGPSDLQSDVLPTELSRQLLFEVWGTQGRNARELRFFVMRFPGKQGCPAQGQSPIGLLRLFCSGPVARLEQAVKVKLPEKTAGDCPGRNTTRPGGSGYIELLVHL